MRLDIYFTEIDWGSVDRDTLVYTPYGCDTGGVFESCGYDYAPVCFTTEKECREHFWFGIGGDYSARRETLGQYIDRMTITHDMNPFETLAKFKTLMDHPHLKP